MFLSHAIDAVVFVASINTRGVRRFVRRQRSLSTIDIGAARVKALLQDDDPRRDPWWSYYAADWRFWYPRIAAVREKLKQP